MTGPLVTAYMASYNHARFLPAALQSVSRQTFDDFEFIVIDDFSCDESVSIIERWLPQQPFPCTFVKHTQNRGVCRTVNEILSLARGRYWAGLGSDDCWYPEFLDRFARRMQDLPEDVAVLYGTIEVMDEQGRIHAPSCGDLLPATGPPEGRVFDDLWARNFVPAMASMTRISCLRSVGGYDESLWFEDWDMWLRLADKYSFAFQPGRLAQYRVVDNSLIHSPNGQRPVTESIRRIRLRWFDRLEAEHLRPEETLYWPNAAEDLYSIGHPSAVRFARKKWHLEKSLRSLILLIFLRLGFPYSGFETLVRCARTLRSMRAPTPLL